MILLRMWHRILTKDILIHQTERLLHSPTATGAAVTENRGRPLGNSKGSKQGEQVAGPEMNVSHPCAQQARSTSYPVDEKTSRVEGEEDNQASMEEREVCEGGYFGYPLARHNLLGEGYYTTASEKGGGIVVVLKNVSDDAYEENGIGGGEGKGSSLRFGSRIRGGVDSHEMHGDTIHEEVAEVVGRKEEACEGTCEEEVWDATYEETNLRIADAAEGAGKT